MSVPVSSPCPTALSQTGLSKVGWMWDQGCAWRCWPVSGSLCHPQVHTHLTARALQEGIYSLAMSHVPSLTL